MVVDTAAGAAGMAVEAVAGMPAVGIGTAAGIMVVTMAAGELGLR
jgi:hypothetical protein